MKKKIPLLFLCALLVSLLTVVKVSAAGYTEGFPLHYTGKAYGVSVLQRYSSSGSYKGSSHPDYLYQYYFKKAPENTFYLMDIVANNGTTVYAVADGTVKVRVTRDKKPNSGDYVVIEHKDGSFSYYGHMKTTTVGNTVRAGQNIGTVGSGHLHFEWSNHDPYCMYEAKGYVYIVKGSGAAEFPHTHSNPYKCKHPKYYGGICTTCSYEYPCTVNAITATAYKVTKSGGSPVWNRPYSQNSKKVNTIANNSYVVVIGTTTNIKENGEAHNKWYLLSDGTWIYSGNVKKGTMPKNVRYIKSGDGLTLRAGASSSSEKLDIIPKGGMVTVNPAKTSGSWIQVKYPAKNMSGWVSGKYLTTTAPKP